MDLSVGLSGGTKTNGLTVVILVLLLPMSNTRPEIRWQKETVAMETSHNADADTVPLSLQGILVLNLKNLLKRNPTAAGTKFHSKQKRSSGNSNKVSEPGLSNSSPTSSTDTPLSTTAENKSSEQTTAPFSTSTDPAATVSNLTSTTPVDLLNDTLLLNLLNNTHLDDKTNQTLNGSNSGIDAETPTHDDSVPKFVKSEVFIICLIVGICLFITLVSVTIGLCYRRHARHKDIPSTKRLSSLTHHSCNGTKDHDSVTLSYINAQFDQKFLQDNPEEMQSLENDTFLNSLESMMFVNRWTDSASTSKL